MMRMGLVGAVGALTLALVVPASVAAHTPPPFWAVIDKATCINKRGEHGFGKVVLQMRGFARNDAAEAASPNYIVIRGMYQQRIEGAWVDFDVTTATSPTYPDGHPDTFQNLLGMALHFESADHPRTRMVMRVEFWDDQPTGDVLLGKVSTRTGRC